MGGMVEGFNVVYYGWIVKIIMIDWKWWLCFWFFWQVFVGVDECVFFVVNIGVGIYLNVDVERKMVVVQDFFIKKFFVVVFFQYFQQIVL